MARMKNAPEMSGADKKIDSLTEAIKAVQDAQQAIQRYMTERTRQNLANTGLLVPMRDLKGVESKLKSYVKN